MSLFVGVLEIILGVASPVWMVSKAVIRASRINKISCIWDTLAELNADIVVPLIKFMFIMWNWSGLGSFIDFSGNLLSFSNDFFHLLSVCVHVEWIIPQSTIINTRSKVQAWTS